jgi:hypothetical protein
LSTIAQQASPDPEDRFAGVNARGDQGMGFSHEKTTHHFHLFTDGGSIEIASNDAADADSQKAIRDHLSMIAQRFSQGDFSIPMFIHATTPPGIETMKRLSKKISYLVQNAQLDQYVAGTPARGWPRASEELEGAASEELEVATDALERNRPATRPESRVPLKI